MRQVGYFLFIVSSLTIGCSRWNVEPKNFYSSSARGDLDTKPYVLYDLDIGGVNGSDKADFYWRAIDKNSFYLSPTNGAAIAQTTVPDPWNIPYLDLTKQTYGATTITSSVGAGSIAFVTNQGRFGAFKVSSYDFTNTALKISWITYTK
jgi:hypothetical protein